MSAQARSLRVDDRRLRGRHARDRDPERRARHVVEPRHVEELDRVRVSPVLAADAELEVRPRLAPDPRREPDEPADARLVDRLERRPVDDLALQVDRHELRLDVVAAEPERGLRQIVCAKREEIRMSCDQICNKTRARQLDHGPDRVVLDLVQPLLVADPDHELAHDLQLVLVVDERDHDLRVRRLVHRLRRPHDRPDLHLVDLGVHDPEPAPARAEHRVLLRDPLGRLQQLLELVQVVRALDPRALNLRRELRQVGQELVQRRVEQPDRHRQSLHRLEQTLEVLLLQRQQQRERVAARVRAVGHDHRPHLRLAVLGHEHVLRPAQADALRAQLARLARVARRVRVRPDLQPPDVVGPAEHGLERLEDLGERRIVLGVDERDVLDRDLAGGPVDRDEVAGADVVVALDVDAARLEVDPQRAGGGDARHAHAAGDERGVARLAPEAGEDALGGVEAGHVVGVGVGPDEHDVAALGGGVDRLAGREDDLALGRAGRGADARREHLVFGLRVEGRDEQRDELVRLDRHQRLLAFEQAFLHGVAREADRGLRRALGVARLEHEQLPVLHRELGVLHVLVVLLERLEDVHQLLVGVRQPLLHLGDVARRAGAGDDVLALGVGQEVAARLGRAGHLVAAERDAGAGRVALVAEHHLLDVDRRAPLVGDPVDAPVLDGALAGPGVEHGADREPQLLLRVLREVLAGLVLVERLEAVDELLERVGVELGVVLDAAVGLDLGDRLLERLAVDAARLTLPNIWRKRR